MLQLDKPDDFVVGRGQAFSGEEFLKEAFGIYNLDYTKYIKIDKSLFRDNEVVKLLSNPQKSIDKLGWRPNRMPFSDHIKIMCDYDYKLASGQTPERPNVFELYP
jgi:GDP-D-mannose dehydratase